MSYEDTEIPSLANYQDACRFVGKSCLQAHDILVECLKNHQSFSKCQKETLEVQKCRNTFWRRIFKDREFKHDINYEISGDYIDLLKKTGRLREGYFECIEFVKRAEYCEEFGLQSDRFHQKPCLEYIKNAEICQRKIQGYPKKSIEDFERCWKIEFPQSKFLTSNIHKNYAKCDLKNTILPPMNPVFGKLK